MELDLLTEAASRLFAYTIGLSSSVQSREKLGLGTDTAVRVRMHDGAFLATTVFEPIPRHGAPPSTIDTILIRTPYGRHMVHALCGCICLHGYRVVSQDTRGRFGSDGRGTDAFLQHESSDGLDCRAWIAETFPESRVGMCGMSFLGYTQWAAGAARESGVVAPLLCIVPAMTSSDMSVACVQGGVPCLEMVVRWISIMRLSGWPSTVDTDWLERARGFFHCVGNVCGTNPQILRALGSSSITDGGGGFRTIVHRACGSDVVPVGMSCDVTAPFWASRVRDPLNVPGRLVHIIAGWYDIMCKGSLFDFNLIHEAWEQDMQTPCPRLTIGPWHHLESLHPGPGGFILTQTLESFASSGLRSCFDDAVRPPDDEEVVLPVQVYVDQWNYGLRQQIAGMIRTTLLREPTTTCHGRWVGLRRWPPVHSCLELYPSTTPIVPLVDPSRKRWWWDTTVRTELPTIYRLETTVPVPGSLVYSYRGSDPTPSSGMSPFAILGNNTPDVVALSERRDLLTFVTDPLDTVLVLIGYVILNVSVICSGDTFDVVGRLCDVPTNGFDASRGRPTSAVCFAEGIRRVTTGVTTTPDAGKSCMSPHRDVSGMVAGTAQDVQVCVQVGPVGRTIAKGHRLLLQIASGAHPRWLPNTGVVDPMAMGAGAADRNRTTTQIVRIGPDTFVHLPDMSDHDI